MENAVAAPQSSKDAALQASMAKRQFLANTSHEIRTPLDGIVGLTDVLLDTPLSDEQRDLATTIQTSGLTLSQIINDAEAHGTGVVESRGNLDHPRNRRRARGHHRWGLVTFRGDATRSWPACHLDRSPL